MAEDKRHPAAEERPDHVELSERFDKSAEVVNFEPSDAYEAPQSMALPSDDED